MALCVSYGDQAACAARALLNAEALAAIAGGDIPEQPEERSGRGI